MDKNMLMTELIKTVRNEICNAAYYLGLPSPFDFVLDDNEGSVSGSYRMAHVANYEPEYFEQVEQPNKSGKAWIEDWLATDNPLQMRTKAMKSVMGTL